MERQPAVAWLLGVALVATIVPLSAAVPSTAPHRDTSASPGPVTDAIPLAPGTALTALPASTPVRIGLTLPFSNESRLDALLAAVSNPSSPEYRHFLSYGAFAREFLPSAGSRADVEETLRSYGASDVWTSPAGTTLNARLPASSVEQLLGVRLVQYATYAGIPQFTAVGAPRLASPLDGLVAGVSGLSRSPAPALALLGADPSTRLPGASEGGPQFIRANASSSVDWFFGSDYAQAYEATELWPGNLSVPHATYPTGIAIATLLASAYDTSTSTELPPWDPSVIDAYFNATLGPGWPLPSLTGVPVPVDGTPAPPLPGSFHGFLDSTNFEAENSLDLEMAGSLAPGSSLYNFYFAGGLAVNPSTFGSVASYLADDLEAALSHNYGTDRLAVVSASFGLPDLNNSQWNADLAIAAATGVTVVASSGDQGNAPDVATGRGDGPWPLWPATAAFNTSGAISVGGVSVALSGVPTSTFTAPPLSAAYDPNVQGFNNVSAWWDASGGFGRYLGTEGGVSTVYPEPWWQFHSAAQGSIVQAAERQGVSQLGRSGPDVAFPANATIAYVAADASETPYFSVVEGTSVAAPVFAGLVADLVAVESQTYLAFTPLGYVDPSLYRIASYHAANPGYPDPFLDVVAGVNAVFSAGLGWDATTGWGGLLAPLWLAADENPVVRDYVWTGPTPTLPPRSSPTLSLTTLALILAGAATAVVAAFVVVATRPRRRTVPPAWNVGDGMFSVGVPTGSGPATPVGGAPPTFACPYCGAERPAEPVRCPKCDAM